jgi:NAD(P)-dependent dehydrogenase (short-subunit alcohol dehydrogenase family)
VLDDLAEMTPLRRLGRPVDIAAAVLFLVSLDGEWINGQTIRVTAASSNPWSFLQPTQ